ncbi:MAG TPA: LexA family transcriptional regulator [Bacteroidales bacterium]|nr:LexA family transcriptional regulator [Bacteroidales bacterium]
MYFQNNIRFLRKRKKRTQGDVAHALDLKRSTLSGYENNVAEPDLQTLINFSDYFNIPSDVLLRENLSNYSEREIQMLESGSDAYVKGSNLRVLSHTVQGDNKENIELVNDKAKAGYTRGYADPEFIRELPSFRLPFLSSNRTYRTFQITGDSMLPIPSGSWVTGEYVQNWQALKDGDAVIVLTLNDGIVFKIMENHLKGKKEVKLHSLNPEYQPYSIPATEIMEIWKFVHYISPDMPDALPPDIEIHKAIANMQQDINDLKEQLGKKE